MGLLDGSIETERHWLLNTFNRETLSEFLGGLNDADANEHGEDRTSDEDRAEELTAMYAEELGATTLQAEDIRYWRNLLSTNTVEEILHHYAVKSVYYGVKGWLFFFVIGPVALGSLGTLVTDLISLANMFRSASALDFDGYDALTALYIVDIGLALWGMLIAQKMMNIRPRAIQSAKKWLLAVLTSGLLPILFIGSISTADIIGSIIAAAIWSSFWYAFLSHSKRVKATFPDSSEALWVHSATRTM